MGQCMLVSFPDVWDQRSAEWKHGNMGPFTGVCSSHLADGSVVIWKNQILAVTTLQSRTSSDMQPAGATGSSFAAILAASEAACSMGFSPDRGHIYAVKDQICALCSQD